MCKNKTAQSPQRQRFTVDGESGSLRDDISPSSSPELILSSLPDPSGLNSSSNVSKSRITSDNVLVGHEGTCVSLKLLILTE